MLRSNFQKNNPEADVLIKCEGGCRVGIMGGSFDPIHYGHLMLAEQIRTQFHLDKVYFIPVGNAPHKEAGFMTDKMQRYEMTVLATMTNTGFAVSRIEIDSDTVSYTINTVKKLKEHLEPEDTLYFITGADAIIELETWKNFEELLGICKFIGATRPGVDRSKLVSKIDELKNKYGADISTTTVPALAISSTDIRDRVKSDQSIRYLLPDSVEHYIYKKNLYKNG